MANDRRLKVLSAIVTDYVRTREPVGSKALVERYRLGVSPATIRNDMAALEDEGYIHQPHTSAGRVPPRRATGSSSTRSPASSPSRRPSAPPSPRSCPERSTWSRSWPAPCGPWLS